MEGSVRGDLGDTPEYDVVVIGGSLAGAGTATVLLRDRPGLRVLILERSPKFGRRVGEATVEVSAFFLCRVLGLTSHLNEHHLVKQAMRFWFSSERAHSLDQCSELGSLYQVRLPAFQVDRSTLDEEVLRRAAALGATVVRDAPVADVELVPGGTQVVRLRRSGVADDGGQPSAVRCRWVIDASGHAALLARRYGWWRSNGAHPTAAVWARFTGVGDWDGLELARKFPEWSRACYTTRGTATNHLTGDGWWAWLIPLKGGDVSVGLVFDQRRLSWPPPGSNGADTGELLLAFLRAHPVGRELLAAAQPVEGDVHVRRNLAYSSTTYAGDGFALVGDAAAFLDPLYSPGMDWISYTAYATAELVGAQLAGQDITAHLERHNRRFRQSYQRWFDAVYRDKYEYLGEYDLMRTAFVLDLGLYYMGIVEQPFRRGATALSEPTFSRPSSVPFYHLMSLYNARLATIARARRERGALGRTNDRRRTMLPGFKLSATSGFGLLRGLARWGSLELSEGWRTWLRAPDAPASADSVQA